MATITKRKPNTALQPTSQRAEWQREYVAQQIDRRNQPPLTVQRKACEVCGLRSAGYLCDNCRADLPGLLARLQQQHTTISSKIESAYQSLQNALQRALPADLDRFTKLHVARAQNGVDFASRYAKTLALDDGLGAIVRAEKAYFDCEGLQLMLVKVESSIKVVEFAIAERQTDEMVRAAGVDWQLVGSEQ
jgi:hypothetical protein